MCTTSREHTNETIIARNIILFALIIDDIENKNIEQIWDIYYHVMIADDPLILLREQASRLVQSATTAEEWNNGKYGATLRFCDSYTFSQVKKLWRFYALRPSDGQAFQEQQATLQHGVERASEIQKDIIGDSTVYTGLRSAAPRTDAALEDISSAYETFWETGSSRFHQQKPTHLNPMFSTTNSRSALHYATDPVIGYHLAMAYIELSKDSPLKTNMKRAEEMGICFHVALDQFGAFVKAFRKSMSALTIRFVITDAMALCHTLQHIQTHKGSRAAGWYRGFRTWEPLVLDTDEYSMEYTSAAAPLLFDVIDTSNLADHFGCLNLLTGAGPLLKPKSTSTLSTELLVKRQIDVEHYRENLLYGDIPTVALLLSLDPVEIWTGTTATSGFDERLTMDMANETVAGQSRFILHWKSTVVHEEQNGKPGLEFKSPLTFEAKELARLLFLIYRAMFRDEDPTSWLSGGRDNLKLQTYRHYTRSSFIAILSLVRRRNMVDWHVFMRELYSLIMTTVQGYSASYTTEMIAYLDLLGLRSMVDSELVSPSELNHPMCPLRHWTSVPSTLCVTMVIPRKKLGPFKNISIKSGSPIVQMVLHVPEIQAQSFYMNIQAAFGHVKMIGERYSENLALEIEDDEGKWDGSAPMVVSAMIPSSVALQKLDLSTEVIFALSQSPHSYAAFSDKLGLDLAISKSSLAGKDVYVTKKRPNMSTHISFSGITAPPFTADQRLSPPSSGPMQDETQTQFHAQLAPDQLKLASVTAHIDIAPGQLQDILRSGAGIKVSQVSLFEISVSFDTGMLVKRVQFPTPISTTNGKTKVARKSSYIEYIAPVPSQKDISARSDSLYPIFQDKGTVGLRTPHYVSLDQLPIFSRQDTSDLSWLSPRISDMFSARERTIRETHMASGQKHGDMRVSFKDSLMSMFSHVTGINGARRHDVLALNNPQEGGVHAFIFISSVRLDMSCQHVVLDAAVLPLSIDIMSEMIPIIEKTQQRGVMSVIVDNKELNLWKHVLPAMVERCRNWRHKSSCEYATAGNIPVSTEFGKQPLCSCGRGKFPPGYNVNLPDGMWKKVSKYATRAAIAPCFSVPFVERPFELKDLDQLQQWQNAGSSTDTLAEKLEALRLRRGSCFRCDKRETEDRGSLLRCGGCRVAEYCSKDCQRKDWKEGQHKSLCPLLK